MFLGHVYQAPAACTTFAGICLESGDWATWFAAIGTFSATVLALAIALRESLQRLLRVRRSRTLMVHILAPDLTSVGGKLTFLKPFVEEVSALPHGESISKKTVDSLKGAAQGLDTPGFDKHAPLLFDLPLKTGKHFAVVASGSADIKHHINMLVLEKNISSKKQRDLYILRITEQMVEVRKSLTALGVVAAKSHQIKSPAQP